MDEDSSKTDENNDHVSIEQTKQKTLFIKRLNHNQLGKKLREELSDFFNSTEKFCNPKSNFIINKKISFPKISSNERQPNFKDSVISSRTNSKFSFKDKNYSSSNLLNNRENVKIKKNFIKIDNEMLKKVFKKFKVKDKDKKLLKIKNNLQMYSKFFPSTKKSLSTRVTLPKDLILNLKTQNRRLINQINFDKSIKKLSKFLSKKSHKKEKDLLHNLSYLYRFKKEIIDNSENTNKAKNKILTSQSTLMEWISSLRKQDIFDEKRESYINIGSSNDPLWSVSVEYPPMDKEHSIKSGCDLNNKDFLMFKKKRNLSYENSKILREVENLDKINVRGENLYNIEYNREMASNRIKILHKAFLDNGKLVLFKDVNKLYGQKTFYKGYK